MRANITAGGGGGVEREARVFLLTFNGNIL